MDEELEEELEWQEDDTWWVQTPIDDEDGFRWVWVSADDVEAECSERYVDYEKWIVEN